MPTIKCAKNILASFWLYLVLHCISSIMKSRATSIRYTMDSCMEKNDYHTELDINTAKDWQSDEAATPHTKTLCSHSQLLQNKDDHGDSLLKTTTAARCPLYPVCGEWERKGVVFMTWPLDSMNKKQLWSVKAQLKAGILSHVCGVFISAPDQPCAN